MHGCGAGEEDDDRLYTSWLHSRWNASSAAAAAAKHLASVPAAAGLLAVLGAEIGMRLLLVVGMVVCQ